MRVESFRVRGFKNLTAGIELRDLGQLEVLHGDNNVGKSNVLEALMLFFGLLRWSRVLSRSMPVEEPATIELNCFQELTGFRPSEIFNLYQPGLDIVLSAMLRISEFDLQAGSERAETGRLTLEFVLTPAADGVQVHLRRCDLGGTLSSNAVSDGLRVDLSAARVASALAYRSAVLTGTEVPCASLIQVDRTELADDGKQRSSQDRGLMSDSLALQLFDAKESLDPVQIAIWELFSDAFDGLESLVGPGRLVPVFDRHTGTAQLVLQHGHRRLPLHLLGSGVQQIVSLVAHLLLTGAAVVAIEEPELNLRFDNQNTLARLLRRLVQDPRGPSQLFISSHSPVFELAPSFWAIQASEAGPVVRRMSREQAASFTQVHQVVPPQEGRAPLSYVTSDGLVQLPDHIMTALGIPAGGGVVMVEGDPGQIEVMSNDAWLARHGEALHHE